MELESAAQDVSETNTNNGGLGPCEVCKIKPAKYTCPRCEVKTCCLLCLNIHKKELECNGARDRTKYIPMKRFTNIDLSSDYRLLEEIGRSVELYRKDNKGYTRDVQLPNHLFRLRKSCLSRRTNLKYLPRTFERRKLNTTKVNFHTDAIFWHLEWIFPNAGNLRLHDELVRESEKLFSVLNKYLVKQEDPELQESLQYYQAADLPGIRILMRAEQKPGSKFYELDPLISLKENFRNKVVIEYPILHVVLKDHFTDIDIIDSDGEEDEIENHKVGKIVIDSIVKKAESEESIYMTMKNLLFLSDEENEMSS